MFFRVENLGPLREAEVDLSKQMILLTGPNSTGKTYLAWSVYGLFRDGIDAGAHGPLVDEILTSPKLGVGFDRLAAVWPRLVEATATRFAKRLHLCFASERHYFENVKVSLRAAPGEPHVEHEDGFFAIGRGGYAVRTSLRGGIGLQFYGVNGSGSIEAIDLSQIPRAELELLLPEVRLSVARTIRSACWPTCTLLPTERVDVDMFAKELSTRRMELVDSAVEAELDERPPKSIARDVGRYPWPIQDSLRLVNQLGFFSRTTSAFADLAREIETLLGGAVDLSEDGEFTFKAGGVALGLHLTSSMIKSLVRLVFYLRHSAVEGDMLMIDEPELNLHPDNQRRIARVLAKAVNRGLRVILSTHSDYFLREINNLIILSQQTKPLQDLRAKYGYQDTELLAPAKVGVYFFKHGTARDVPVEQDGFEVESIEEEINRMNALSQEIFAARYE